MALDSEQKHKILFHLGYPAKTIIADSTHFNSVVNSRLNNLNSDVEDLVAALLADLDTVRTRMFDGQKTIKAKRVDDIEVNTDWIRDLKTEYRRLARDLAELLDLPLQKGGGAIVGVCL